MSKYTTELRFICEMNSGFNREEIPNKTPEEIIRAARPIIFNFDYPVYDAGLKEPLELKILRHYYTREIGQETFGLWQWRLQTKLNEIMPLYNQLYEAQLELANTNGLHNIDVTTNRTYEPRVTTIDNTETTSEIKDAFNDTPQGGLSDVENLNYLSEYRDTKNTSAGQNIRTQTGADSENIREYGYRGGKTLYELLEDIRKNIYNIDMLIVSELTDLFMQIY